MKKYQCLCCLMRGMRARLDRKARLFFQCEACGAILFPRGGHLGLANAATMRLLDVDDNLRWARAEGFKGAETPESITELLTPIPSQAAASTAMIGTPAASEKLVSQ